MFKSRNFLRAALIGAVLGQAQVLGYPTETKTEVVTELRRSKSKTRQLATYGQVYPRSRKTRTAAQLKRAALRRRNIAKRGKK